MDIKDIAKELNLEEIYVSQHWAYIADSYKRRGIELVKVGRGPSANYGIKGYGDEKIRWVPKYEEHNITLADIAELLGVSEHYLKVNWAKVRRAKEEQNIHLYKIGRGDLARYGYAFGDEEICWRIDK